MARAVDWYFDFISPFSYLQTARFDDLPADVEIRFRPVLFAGLLKHYETRGPAEVAPKRIFIYRQCHWLAQRMGVPFRMPPAHPFNPLKALRLCIALGSTRDVVETIFRSVWCDGHLPSDPDGWAAIAAAVGADDADDVIRAPGIKDALYANLSDAIAADVFGVPTFVAYGTPFWGVDATDFFLQVLADPAVLDSAEMRRITGLPAAARRTT